MGVESFRPPGGWSNGWDGHISSDKAPIGARFGLA